MHFWIGSRGKIFRDKKNKKQKSKIYTLKEKTGDKNG